MVTPLNDAERRNAILGHIARYRLSLRPVIEKLFFDGKSCDNVLRAMVHDELIVARPESDAKQKSALIPGGYKYYQLSLKAADQFSLPSSRTTILGPGAFDKHIAILWFCCMGEKRYSLLDSQHLAKLFAVGQGLLSEIPAGPYCIELEGKHRVFRIISTGPTSTDQYCIGQFKEHLQDATSHPVLKRWIEVRREV